MIAHRAGNDSDALRHAVSLGVDLVEADVRLFHGRPVVRHLKTIGPIPLYWDRWALASPFGRERPLARLLESSGETELLLDLKGPGLRLGELVLEELRPYLGERGFTICARWWRLLDGFEDVAVRRTASAGSARQLQALLRHFAGRRLDAIAVPEQLVDEAFVADIRSVADLVLAWPVNSAARAHALLELGVDGLISDHVERITPVIAAALE